MPTLRSAADSELHYELRGRGPLLVCQPGGPARPASYLDTLGGLTEHRTLLLLDPRGAGRSAPADDCSFAALGADLEALRRHLDVPRLDLLGHSAGCWPALWFAAHHPERLARLTLLTPSRLPIPPQPAEPEQPELVVRWFADRPWFATALDAYDRNDFASADAAALLYADDTTDIRAHHTRDGDSRRAEKPAALFWSAELDPAALAAVTAPVQVVAGEHDIVVGRHAPDVMASWFADSDVTWLPGAGHFPWLTNPAETVAACR